MRPPRPQAAGASYHLTTRGNRRQPIFDDHQDRLRFLAILRSAVRRRGWTCHSYCLMTNHYHVLVTTREPDLAIGMHTLNHLYARSFNRRYKLTGHLFERRYNSVLVEDDSHFLELLRYQALNPVRAGICERADDWPWSSYRATLGLCERPDFLSVNQVLQAFSKDPARAQRLLHEFVHDPSALSRAA